MDKEGFISYKELFHALNAIQETPHNLNKKDVRVIETALMLTLSLISIVNRSDGNAEFIGNKILYCFENGQEVVK